MDFLILAHLGDETALRVYAALRARHGTGQVKLVSSEELVLAPYWAHILENAQVTTNIRLSDGTTLDSANIGVVFNRLVVLTMPHFAAATKVDQDYAIMEMTALCLSWLASLPCPVINVVTPPGLGTQTRTHAEWLWLAGKAGLPTQDYHLTTDPRWFREPTDFPYQRHKNNSELTLLPASRQPTIYLETLSEQWQSLLVAGDKVVGDLTDLYGEQVIHLAKLADCDLLEVILASSVVKSAQIISSENWKVCRVNSFPHLQTTEAISAIVQLLENRRIEFLSEPMRRK